MYLEKILGAEVNNNRIVIITTNLKDQFIDCNFLYKYSSFYVNFNFTNFQSKLFF